VAKKKAKSSLDGFDFEEPAWEGLKKVISGGQTGADVAGLHAAKAVGLETGGQAPEGYLTNAGCMPQLAEFGLTAAGSYLQRTAANVKASDATLILSNNPNSAGTAATIRLAKQYRKPYLLVNTAQFIQHTATRGDAGCTPSPELIGSVVEFIRVHRCTVLNVAGNRERHSDKRITMTCFDLCVQVLKALIASAPEGSA
jgi:hypothetical protein